MTKEAGNYAFIDATNLHKGIQELGWQLDYRRFRVFLRDRYAVEEAYLFLGFVPQFTSLYRNLQSYGYVLIFKPTVLDPAGEVKGNCDGELILQAAIDFYEQHFKSAVLVSGDGDFACLVSFLQQKRALTAILSPSHEKCSMLLKRTNARITFLQELRQKLEYKRPK